MCAALALFLLHFSIYVVEFGWDMHVVVGSFEIPLLLHVETLLGPTEEEPLSGYHSVQQHAVVLVHSKNTHTHKYTAIIGQVLKQGDVCVTGALINQSVIRLRE